MGILKISGIKNHLSAGSNTCRHSPRPVGQAARAHLRANSFEIEPDGTRAGKLTFAEDFTREHSLSGLRVASIGISGSFWTATGSKLPRVRRKAAGGRYELLDLQRYGTRFWS